MQEHKIQWTLEAMVQKTNEHMNQILRENLYEMNLEKSQLQRLERQKKELRDHLNRCGIGDDLAKTYMLEFLQECLLKLFHFNAENIDDTFYFQELKKKNPEYLFAQLLWQYKKNFGKDGLEHLIEEKELLWNCGKRSLVITGDQIEKVYVEEAQVLNFVEKMELLTQKIYSSYKGLGIADEIRDMHIDGVSGGVSGASGDCHSLWIFYKGNSIHLDFLDFGSQQELERICRNICRYQQPGEISKARGYLVHEMADHSRIVVARPDFAESWMFFVRKLDQGKKRSLLDLFPGEENRILRQLLNWIMKGCCVTGITGMQGCGKTTLLMALTDCIPREYTLRVLELAFELHLRELYPERNIVTFRETGSIGGWEGLELQKKTDGAVSIIGEVASARVAAWMVESGQSGSLFTLFTHHAKTTRSLICSLRNSLLKEGSFQNEVVAAQQVVQVLDFDIHLHMNREGKRFIERITHIKESDNQPGQYLLKDLMVYENGSYVQKNTLDLETKQEMARWMTQKEQEEFFAADI